VLNRWPDGSVRFALLAGRVELAAGQSLELGLFARPEPAPTTAVDDSGLAGLDASLRLEGHGELRWNELLGRQAARNGSTGLWTPGRVRELVRGPWMSAWLYRANLGSSEQLSAWLELRLMADGEWELLPWLENSWFDRAGASSFAGRLNLQVQGSERFSQTIDLPHHCRVPALSGNLPYRRQPGSWARVRHDTEQLQQTGLVPSYHAGASNALLERLARSYSPLGQLGYPAAMGSTGYHPSIGLLPEWDVAYLVSQGDARAWDAVMAHALGSGRYPLVQRDSSTLQAPRPAQYPNLVLRSGSGISGTGSSSTGQFTPAVSGSAAPTWASSHHPSLGYLAYLLSGWSYFAEAAQFSAAVHHFKQTDTVRQGAQGLLLSEAGANTTRGAAWALRSLLQGFLVSPDGDPQHAAWLAVLDANIQAMHQRYVARPSHPQGFCKPYSDYTAGDGKYLHAAWMEDFLTAAWGYIKAARLPLASERQQQLDAFFAWKARSIVGRLGAPGDPQAYHYADAAQYTLAIGPADSLNYENGSGPWYAHWGEIYQATLGQPNRAQTGDSLRGGYFPDPTSYWGNLQPALAYAVQHGAAGAAEARQRMTSDPGWSRFMAGLQQHPVWGVRPAS